MNKLIYAMNEVFPIHIIFFIINVHGAEFSPSEDDTNTLKWVRKKKCYQNRIHIDVKLAKWQ